MRRGTTVDEYSMVDRTTVRYFDDNVIDAAVSIERRGVNPICAWRKSKAK